MMRIGVGIGLMGAILFVGLHGPAFAGGATITSAQDGDWSSTLTWVGGVVPDSSGSIQAAVQHTVGVTTSGQGANVVVIGTATSSGTVNVSAGSFTSNNSVQMGVTNAGTLNVTGGTVTAQNFVIGISATSLVDISGGSITLNSSGGTALAILIGTLRVTGANATFSLSASGGQGINIGNNGTLIIEPTANGAAGLSELTIPAGGVFLGGSSTLTLDVSSYAPSVGDKWDVISAPDFITDTFGVLSAPTGYTITQSTVAARGTTPQKIVIEVTAVPDVEKIYWTDQSTSKVQAGNLDGSGPATDLFDNASDGLSVPFGIRLDSVNSLVYWCDAATQEIEVGNMDGSGSPTVLFDSKDGINSPTRIALDLNGGEIYWTDSNGDVAKGNINGSGGLTILFNSADGTGEAYGIALDVPGGKLYMSDKMGKKIMVGNLDGSGSLTVLFDSTDGVADPADVALDLLAGKIYWADGQGKLIQSGDISGSGSPTVLFDNASDGLAFPLGIALDVQAGKVYWADAGTDKIQVGNMDGSGSPTDLFDNASDGLTGPTALTLDLDPVPTVWVHFGFGGVEDGSEMNPYNTLQEALAIVSAGGTVNIKGGSGTPATADTPTFNQDVTIQAVGGPVTIGIGARAAGQSSESGFVSRAIRR